MIRGVLFDYDGTIAETRERQFAWFKHWAKMNDIPFKIYDIHSFIEFYNEHCNEKSVQAVYDALGLPCVLEDREHPVWVAYEEFKDKYTIKFYSGMRDAIRKIHTLGNLSEDALTNKRLRLGINTSNTWRTIQKELKDQGVLGYFDSFVTRETLEAYDGNNSPLLTKPSKISVALSLDVLDCDGESVIHVGDTLSDLKASIDVRRSGTCRFENLITIGVGWGYDGRKSLEHGVTTRSGSVYFDHIVDKPKQLVDVIRGYVG